MESGDYDVSDTFVAVTRCSEQGFCFGFLASLAPLIGSNSCRAGVLAFSEALFTP